MRKYALHSAKRHGGHLSLLHSISGRRLLSIDTIQPNIYWHDSQEREAQYLYVAFCELASAMLDYCEGATMRLSPSDELHHCGRSRDAAYYTRQNWAGTVLYYSLVHTARLLVFLACGDFPKAHGPLGLCFDDTKKKPLSTDWLRGFLGEDIDKSNRVSTEVSFANLLEYWSVPNSDRDVVPENLARFGKLLAKGKKRREENNYEALLVAHEYRHDALSQSFTSLSDSMEKPAYFALKIACEWLGRALNRGLGNLVKINNSEAQAFFSAHIGRRIQEPIKQWYSLQIVEKVALVLVPLIAEQSLAYELADEVSRLDGYVDWEIFTKKQSLMMRFNKKIDDFRGLV
jgi:hypothetical protein